MEFKIGDRFLFRNALFKDLIEYKVVEISNKCIKFYIEKDNVFKWVLIQEAEKWETVDKLLNEQNF